MFDVCNLTWTSWTTRPCHPTRPSQVTHIKHIYTQLQAKGQLIRVVQLVQVKLHTSNISIHNHRPKDNSSVSSNSSKSSYTHQTYLYTIAGQRTTCPCRPTRPSQVRREIYI